MAKPTWYVSMQYSIISAIRELVGDDFVVWSEDHADGSGIYVRIGRVEHQLLCIHLGNDRLDFEGSKGTKSSVPFDSTEGPADQALEDALLLSLNDAWQIVQTARMLSRQD